MKEPNSHFSGRLDLWSEWIWKVGPEDGEWRLLDISPRPEEGLKEAGDWVTAVGSKGSWYGPEKLFREAFEQCLDQPIEKGKKRPELNPKQKPKQK